MFQVVLSTIAAGGWIMWPIIASSLVVWWIGLWQWYEIFSVNTVRKRFATLWFTSAFSGEGGKPLSCGNQIGDELLARRRSRLLLPGMIAADYNAAFLPSLTAVTGSLRTMGVLVSVAPLLGLLGTVAGMIETFRIITVYGVGNPALTAEGISIALLTTEAGLTVAFPGLLLHAFVNNRRNSLRQKLSADGERFMQTVTKNGDSRDGARV